MKELLVVSLLLLSCSLDLCISWKMPSKEFLNDFAQHENCVITVLYIVEKTLKAIEWTKRNDNVKTVLQKNIVGKNLSDLVLSGQELHVFIPDDSNMQKSMSLLKDLYKQRSYSNSEHWLIDMSLWNSTDDFTKSLKDMKLDFGKKSNFYKQG